LDFVEGYPSGRAIASARSTRRGRRPWRVWTLFAREPGELGFRWRGIAGPCREGEKPKPVMYGSKRSDLAIVAMKPTNKAGSTTAAEPVEPRAGAEGNADQQSTHWTQSRARVTQALGRVRQVSQGKEEGTVHRVAPPGGSRPTPVVVLRSQAQRGTGGGRGRVAGLRGRTGEQSSGPACTSPPGRLPGTTRPAQVPPQAGWAAAAVGDRRTGGQTSPASGRGSHHFRRISALRSDVATSKMAPSPVVGADSGMMNLVPEGSTSYWE